MADEGRSIENYMGQLPKATADDLVEGNGLLIRTAQGMKEISGDSFVGDVVFEAIYGTTTYAAIGAAVKAGKLVVCRVQGNIYMRTEDYTATGFVFEKTDKKENGKVYTRFIQVTENDEWSSENEEIATKSYVDTMLGNVEALLAAL